MPTWDIKPPKDRAWSYTGEIRIDGGVLKLVTITDGKIQIDKAYAPGFWEYAERKPEPEA